MVSRRIWGIVLAICFTTATSYAGEMLREEAIKYYNEGVMAQKSGDINVARTSYRKAMMLSEGGRPDIAKAIYNNFGVMYVHEENWEAAAQAFNEALLIDPNFKEVNYNMGIFYAKMGDPEKALEYLKKALNRSDSLILIEEKKE